jgi:flavin reductase (DIM6/NTAB) family NADH-FMN oxidoreductase RutF
MDERRREARLLTLKAGAIRSAGAPASIDCAILDISDGGARILVPVNTELAIDPSRESYSCKLAWKSGSTIGVSFQSRTVT